MKLIRRKIGVVCLAVATNIGAHSSIDQDGTSKQLLSECLFDSRQQDSLALWLDGNPGYLWFSDKAIREHTRHTLMLSQNKQLLPREPRCAVRV
jgi:hypothetical protein